MSKNISKIYFKNIYKNFGDNNKKSNIKKLLSKTLINNNQNSSTNIKKFNIKKNNKKNSCPTISESAFPDKNKDKYSDLSEEKLTIKTTLLKIKEKEDKNIVNEEQNNYHINFELLSNAGINSDININMAFI